MQTASTIVLNSGQRRFLDAQTQRAREAAQRAAEDALRALAVSEPSRPAYLGEQQNKLRLALREKARQLGDDTSRAGVHLTNLVHDVAYEQWHRLLFARFLEVNGLLRHPEYRDIPLSLEDCGDLASDLGEPDAWAVAARFASEILPDVFRLTDPAVQVRFAAEHRNTLERLLLEIPAEVFTTEDALGWVYQFWQTAEKKRVNDSGVKIGGADLSSVTQLFTENYMVRFLLENSLGAWWAARRPASPLVAGWVYLRHNEDGTPAAGPFSDWPEHAADVTVMDPCCGSGHFLVAMFGMLWRMRTEEEGLTPAEAQDAVLRDNLRGLELDPRCTQIATFNVALEAWKSGGFRELPAPQIACSGVPVRGSREEWEAHAGGDQELRKAMRALHSLFKKADTLGSLIQPRADVDGALLARDLSVGTDWDQVRGLLRSALDAEGYDVVLGNATDDVVRAAALLDGTYTLVVTNVPYLSRQKMNADLYDFVVENHGLYSGDLAATMVDRCRKFAGRTGTVAVVIPDKLLIAPTYRAMRQDLLRSDRWVSTAILGPRAFSTTMFDFGVALLSMDPVRPSLDSTFPLVDASGAPSFETQQLELLRALADRTSTRSQLDRPDSRIGVSGNQTGATLAEYADAYYGLGSGDYGHYGRKFWELPALGSRWVFQQSTVSAHEPYGGREHILLWEDGRGALSREPGAFLRNTDVWGSRGVMVSLTGSLWCSIYHGDAWDSNAAPIIPKNPDLLPALWAFCASGEFSAAVRSIDRSVKVMNKTLLKIPFDADRWTSIAKRSYPYGLPEPTSIDVTQWLFNGHLPESTHPLQVAVARLLGYRWPEQSQDSLDDREDLDGIASLQSLPGEPDLATRLRELLSTVYGREWSSALERKLVTQGGGKTGKLEDWLRDTFFIQHVKVFANRPFLWHIWDGRKDGFSAIVNYHKLDRRTLEKLTFTSLGAWIERQKHETRAERAGADTRLAAAEDLQRRLKLILEGAPPHDVYVRWKPMAEQPIGWEPDLDDGVRLNIRPFVTAGILRSKVNVHWKADRGTNPDGSKRHNDLHPTLDERRAARRAAEATE
ncbi:hypothetical protein ACFWXB_17415 [Tsukamurella tyrosinosolvens]|uniref:hypothetical protein n=1 Tax=Tsukamurella tyrosinosolvens TaxID=57704 RepID=UPI001AF563ED|nr:hypothetical protein [Tsukamurella tyrosinosolvens]QRY83246.1 hypothetical protein JVY00_15340 [Tsukamurella tyrosinosolvens]